MSIVQLILKALLRQAVTTNPPQIGCWKNWRQTVKADSWGPVKQTPENNLWLWVNLLTSWIVSSPRVLQALLHGNGLHNRIFTRRLFSYWDAMDCNATTLRCLCDMGLCSAAILCLMSTIFLFWRAKACISCLLPDEMFLMILVSDSLKEFLLFFHWKVTFMKMSFMSKSCLKTFSDIYGFIVVTMHL